LRERHDRRRLATLWAGVLAGPLVFLALLQANYVLSYVSCETGRTWFLHAATLGGAGVVAAVGYLCWRVGVAGQQLIEEPAGAPVSRHTSESRAIWMGYVGAANSVWFLIVMLAMDIPVLLLRTCQ
jgi:hypothetical protein